MSNESYQEILHAFGYSEELVRAQSENMDDQIPFPEGDFKVEVRQSPIEGEGLFATRAFEPGELIAPARLGNRRTPAGRYTNHSGDPNAGVLVREESFFFVAVKPISPGDEITVNYREVLTLNTEVARLMAYHDKMDRFESELVKFPQIEIPTKHHFHSNPGMYVREAFAPAGTLLTSKIHKTNHPFVMLRGDQSIMDDDGSWIRISAPYMGSTKAGSRRVVYAHTDTVMVTFHSTEETDLNKVEDELYARHDAHLGLEGPELQAIRSLQRGPNSQLIKGELQ